MEAERGLHSEDYPVLPDIKVIIIGSKAEFKCQAANAILDQNDCKLDKEILESEIKQRTVLNRCVTLVITPGWWRSFTLAESAKSLKTEIVHSLTLCADPHAFLLVINLHEPFTVMHLNSVVEHMEILGEQIWDHTIVLLMYDNKTQRNADSKQLIQAAGTKIDTVIKKCGNRVHVFNYTDSKGINVEKLFHEIERLSTEHEEQSFKIDSKLVEDMEEKRRTVKKRAEERATQVKTKMQTLKAHLTEKMYDSSEIRIVLMGRIVAGKTSVMNTILKTRQEVSRTKRCVKIEAEVEKRKVILIDTPGWWPYASTMETPESVKWEIKSAVSMCSPGPHVVLLVLQSGVVFSKAYGRSIKEHMELLGVNVWSHCIVVFTRGDWMGTPTIEEHIESEGEALQWLINECGNRYHVLNNTKCDEKQVRELMEKVEMMVRTNKEHLTPAEGETGEIDSGWGSENLERESLQWNPPQMDDYINKWLENADAASTFSRLAEGVSEDI